ncbi:MAG TPA: protein kinase [Oligoflexia bacterium]|nr:protein kinase [Oligoflexia bacterium]HMR25469.1 protein kinase [Oligoflexia bacterium]
MSYRYPIKFGKYLLTRRIAVGGMAEVFKAKLYGPRGFEKTLAIKRILPEFSEDEEFVAMFVDEARISSKLHHGNIVQVFDFGQVDDAYYLAMEFVDGSNLKNLFRKTLKSQNLFPRHLAIYIALQVAKALEYAHQIKQDDDNTLELVHRDISPQNILIAHDGQVKLTDFGIAKASIKLSKTQPGKVQGKLSYMSPEQAMGKNLDRRSDIFSLGIILYELISGEKVYNSENTSERYKRIRKAQIEPLKSLAPDISDYLNQSVMQLLEKDPWARPNNCTEVIQKLSESIKKYSMDELALELSNLMHSQFPKESSTEASQLNKTPSLLDVPGHLIEEISAQTEVRPDDLSSIDHEVEQQRHKKEPLLIHRIKEWFQLASVYLFEGQRKQYTFGILIVLLFISVASSFFLAVNNSVQPKPIVVKNQEKLAPSPDSPSAQPYPPTNTDPLSLNSLNTEEHSLEQFSSNAEKEPLLDENPTISTGTGSTVVTNDLNDMKQLKQRQEKIHQDLEAEQTIQELQKDVASLKQENQEKAQALEEALDELETLKKGAQQEIVKQCPAGMKKVQGGSFQYGSDENDPDRNDLTEPLAQESKVKSFCMDQFEYSTKKASTPDINISWHHAQKSCQQQGKRLCTVQEWEYACKSLEDSKYGFSTSFEESQCAIQNDTFETLELLSNSSKSACKNSLDIYNLSGNVLEWTQSAGKHSPNTYVAKGGSMQRPLYQARCSAHIELDADLQEPDLGFRCCKNF